MSNTEARHNASKKYNQKAYDKVGVTTKREDAMRQRVNDAAKNEKKSANQYMINAIETALARDGFGLDTVKRDKDNEG